MLEKFIPLFRKPGLLNPILKLGQSISYKLDLHRINLHRERIKNQPLLESRRRRVFDAITMRHEPDRVPVIGNGVNFFPAKYAGETRLMIELMQFLMNAIRILNEMEARGD
jgi:hypothetical protein